MGQVSKVGIHLDLSKENEAMFGVDCNGLSTEFSKLVEMTSLTIPVAYF